MWIYKRQLDNVELTNGKLTLITKQNLEESKLQEICAFLNLLGDLFCLELDIEQNKVKDYQEALNDKQRLTKELDVIINGENAAERPSLCDVVNQMKMLKINFR